MYVVANVYERDCGYFSESPFFAKDERAAEAEDGEERQQEH